MDQPPPPTRGNPLSERSSLGNSARRVDSPYVQSTVRKLSNFPTPAPLEFRNFSRKASLGASHDNPPSNTSSLGLSSLRPAMADFAEQSIDVGDTVEVPGGMTGTVKFIGSITGKKGTFAGVELSRGFADRGKNDGDVDGTRYFTTTVRNAGIFLPAHRAVKLSSPTSSAETFPATPTTPALASFEQRNLRASSQSPQTPSASKISSAMRPGQRPNFSQSMGPTARAPSPQQKTIKRPSLPRPESPLRKQPSLPNTQTPARPSVGPGAGLSHSVRGNRPSGISPGPKAGFALPKTPGANRSPSRTNSRTENRSPEADSTPTNFSRSVANGASRPRIGSRAQSTSGQNDIPSVDSEENERLKRNLEERDRQLKEQAASLAEMENSLAELQTMVAATTSMPAGGMPDGADSQSDSLQLRIMLRDKNDKIASLTAEFDNHRADFRSTIDTLEMASTETERVYEQRVQDLLRENQELQDRHSDVEGFARELKRLEEFVQELEEGLEDARRGEAEARSEVEFLRGEVERGRTELRREREKAAKALKGAAGAVHDASADGAPNGAVSSREMAARDDEIRGLKAIIHSLSSSGPEASPSASNRNTLTSTSSGGGNSNHSDDREQLSRMRVAMDQLAREKSELRGLIERKNFREEELERELAELRGADASNSTPRKHSDSVASAKTAIRPGTSHERDAPAGDSKPPPPPPPPAEASQYKRLGLPVFPSPPDGAAAAGVLGAGRGPILSRPGTGYSPKQSPASATFEDASERQDEGANGAHDGGIMAQLTGEGPVAGKASGRVDMGKWCALCERDGHDSVDCPLEDDF